MREGARLVGSGAARGTARGVAAPARAAPATERATGTEGESARWGESERWEGKVGKEKKFAV